MDIGYKRVSTIEQSTARQLANISLERVYEDFISGATLDRPELNRCLDALRKGDTLHVHSVDRLSRSMRDLIDIVERVLSSGASLLIYTPLMQFSSCTDDYMQTFQLQLWAAVGQMERSMSKARQREGIAQAKIKGTKSGKPFGQIPLDLSLSSKALELRHQGLTQIEIGKRLSLSRPSVVRLLAQANQSI